MVIPVGATIIQADVELQRSTTESLSDIAMSMFVSTGGSSTGSATVFANLGPTSTMSSGWGDYSTTFSHTVAVGEQLLMKCIISSTITADNSLNAGPIHLTYTVPDYEAVY